MDILKKKLKINKLKKEKINIDAKKLGPKHINLERNSLLKEYLIELNSAISDKEVSNISLSGGYGTGKSTIIKNYIDNYLSDNEYKCISIGSFINKIVMHGKNNTDKVTENNKIIDKNEIDYVDKIEKSILKQLIYSNYLEDMKESHIERIKSKKYRIINVILLTYLTVMPTIYFILNYVNSRFNINIFKNFKIMKNKNTYIILIVVYLIFLILLVVKLFDYLLSKTKISKVKISNKELEFNNKKELVFSEKLNEIVYFFSKNRIKVVFFEDIDRFPSDVALMVIEELKELNKIISTAVSVKTKPTFVYAFKDELFPNYQDRSKFYDYNISIIPLSTSYNSLINIYNILLDNNINTDELNENVLEIVSRYVYDYRTLINIVGDYTNFKKIIFTNPRVITNRKIKKDEEIKQIKEYSKLFALMAIKNVNITEYSKINTFNNEIIFEIKKVKELIYDKINEIDKNLQLIEKENEELIDKSYALKTKILVSLGYEINDINYIYFNDKKYNMKFFCKNVLVTDIINSLNINNEEILLDDYKEEIKEIVKNDNVIRINKMKIDNNLNTLDRIDKNTFDYNFYDDNIDEHLILLDDLICRGFIDENFISYATSPATGSNFSLEDNQFLLNANHNINSCTLEIKNPESIIKYLNNIKGENLMNISLINYLLNYVRKNNYPAYNKDDYKITSKKLERKQFYILNEILNSFKKMNNNHFEFLNMYIESDNMAFLLTLMFENGVDLFEILNEHKTLKDTKKENIMIIKLLNSIFEVSNLKKYIHSLNEFKYIVSNYSSRDFDKNKLFKNETTKNNLIDFDIKFSMINDLNVENIEFVIDNNLYEINIKNLQYIYQCKVDNIILSKNKKVLNNILNNINEFGDNVYLKSNIKINNKKNIEAIISKNNLSVKLKKKIYEKENIKVDYDEEYIDDIIKYNRLKPNWHNVKKLFNNNITINIIINYILDNEQILFNKIEIISDDIAFLIFLELVKKKKYELSLECLKYIKNINNSFRIKLSKDYKKDFIESLIELDIVEYNKFNYNLVINLEDKYRLIYIENAYNTEGCNCLKYGGFKLDEIFKLINKENIGDRDFEILNKSYLYYIRSISENDTKDKISKILLYMFKRNKKYKFLLKRSIYNNIFDKYKKLFKILSYGNGKIIFVLK